VVDNKTPIKVNPREWIQPVAAVNKYGPKFMQAVQTGRFPADIARAAGNPNLRESAHRAYGGLIPGYATGAQIAATVQKQFPNARFTSGYRPGANDLHGSNQAADMAGPTPTTTGTQFLADMKVWWTEHYGAKTTELIYDGIANRTADLYHGAEHAYNAATTAQHHNHVHIGMTGPLDLAPGVVAPAGATIQVNWQDIFSALKGQIANLFAVPARAIVNAIPYDAPPDARGIPKKMGNKIIDSAVAWFTGRAQGKAQADANAANATAGSTPAPATTGPIQSQVSQVFASRGWGSGASWADTSWIIQKESGWNPNAQNPTSTASGLFQMIDGTWNSYKPRGSAAAKMRLAPINEQAMAGLSYISGRYGSPSAARAFWQSHNYYDSGGALPRGLSLAMNKTGHAETVLPIEPRKFIASFRDGGRVREKFSSSWLRKHWTGHWPGDWREHIRNDSRYVGNRTFFTDDYNDRPRYQPPPPPMPPPPPPPPPPAPVIPKLPTGDLARIFQSTIQQVAPELWMTLQSGAVGQAGALAQGILGNPGRMSALQQAISGQAGGATANISELLSNLVKSVAPATANYTPQAPSATAAAQLLDTANSTLTSTTGTTVAEGAIQMPLTIQGNADSVTVRQLQGTLQQFGSQIVQELVART
jgi:hypothetical protein